MRLKSWISRKIVAHLNLNSAVSYILRRRRGLRDRGTITSLFNQWKMEDQFGARVHEKIKTLWNNEKPDGIFLEIGFVFDAFDVREGYGYAYRALMQVARHYNCTPQETLDNYEIVITQTPASWSDGIVWARKIRETQKSLVPAAGVVSYDRV